MGDQLSVTSDLKSSIVTKSYYERLKLLTALKLKLMVLTQKAIE